VLASRNEKWRPGEGNLYLAAGLWTEPELRAALEAGFRELGWAREAEALRGLSAFLLPELEPRIAGRRRDRACGHWRVSHEPTGLFLHPIEEPGAASR
jgi:hypothetical protein